MIINEQFNNAFENFMTGAQAIVDHYMEKNFPNLPKVDLTYKIASKYIKVIREGSVYCFINTSNGDVLKAASWAAPAKGARGNIYNADYGVSACTAYGAEYLR